MGTTLLLALAVFSVLLISMSIGVFFGRTKLRGSCGGLAGADGCNVCGAPSEASCRKEHEQ